MGQEEVQRKWVFSEVKFCDEMRAMELVNVYKREHIEIT